MKIFIIGIFLFMAMVPNIALAQELATKELKKEVSNKLDLLEKKLKQVNFASKKWLKSKKVQVDTSDIFIAQVYFSQSSCQYHLRKDGKYHITMNGFAIRSVGIDERKYSFNMTPINSLAEKSVVIEWLKGNPMPDFPGWQLNRVSIYLSEYLAVLEKVGI